MRNFLAGIGAALCVFMALAIGYLVGGGSLGDGGGNDGGGNETGSQSESEPALRATILALSDGPGTPTPTAPAVTDVPQATATPTDTGSQTAGSSALPDRTNCDEIYGTQYRSEREKQFFLATCIEPGAAGGSTGVTEPAGPAPTAAQTVAPTTDTSSQANNRFTWGGSGGEYIAFSTTLCQSGTVGYTVSGEYSGRSFCTATRVQGMPPFTCPQGAEARVQEASANGAPIGEVYCITPFTPTPPPGG
jgi:hypothetical protein